MHGRRPPCRLGWKVQIGVGYMLCGLFARSVELCFWRRLGVGGLQQRGLGCVHSVFGVLRVFPMLWHCLLAGAGPLAFPCAAEGVDDQGVWELEGLGRDKLHDSSFDGCIGGCRPPGGVSKFFKGGCITWRKGSGRQCLAGS